VSVWFAENLFSAQRQLLKSLLILQFREGKMTCRGSRTTFFPKVDGAILRPKYPPPSSYPEIVGPTYDLQNVDHPIKAWSTDLHNALFPESAAYESSIIPEKPLCLSDRYLRASLAENERLRLSVLWYYTRDILMEHEFLSGLQEKANLAQESTGWDYAVIGILDINVYIRLATVGLELGILPRGETLCAHTVTQPLNVGVEVNPNSG
jgi:hypothetical protein